MVNSRNKGSGYERDVRVRLELELGMKFERVLDQWREPDLPDLVCEDDDFPFVIECKRYKKGGSFAKPSHWDQVCQAAVKAKKIPALVYKFDRLPERWRIPIDAITAIYHREPVMNYTYCVEMEFREFCYVSRELLSAT